MNAAPNAESGAKPPILLITGVSGSGKTTIGSLLAGRLGWEYAEADSFHPAANIAKMSAGHPLTDEDRRPWLDNIGRWIDETSAKGRPGVVTSSALKRSYRDQLRQGRPQVRLIYLDADRATVARRLTARNGHFFPPELLDSQFGDLEPPTDDEQPVRVQVDDGDAPLTVAERLIRAERLEAVEAAHDEQVPDENDQHDRPDQHDRREQRHQPDQPDHPDHHHTNRLPTDTPSPERSARDE